MEPFSYDLAGIGDKKERVRRIFLNKIPEFDGLDPIKRRKDDILVLAGKRALGQDNRGASMQVILDKVADRLGTCAHYVEILG